ncbi:hypothetical protein [Nonomuraea diastatica]|uniref:Uncharacterized protein n=1 Tax=Nonomuraea diastatica TaxID=1848329 RepID=A0A4R4X6R1_9ACTN|nr:hypothetical protein [Nonomuraea diastatica]TDD25969.1 hypothetical protein E1294_01610 [Nonomuraea diastatica]
MTWPPVFGDKGRLWVTTNDAVYQYVKSTGEFTTENANEGKVDVRLVKAIGDQQGTGQILRTRPKNGCGASWCTDTVEFFGGTASRTVRRPLAVRVSAWAWRLRR